MKGNIDDPSIQKILAEALVNERNPGTRIRTVNALANQTNVSPSPKVKQALITALEFDSNPAVRREALKALLEFPYDNEINDCLLYVLQRDKNSALRIAAINGLASAKLNGQIINEETLKVLNQKVKNDDNEYVRIRAASLLKEDKLQ
jgi:HEAT repeat protein